MIESKTTREIIKYIDSIDDGILADEKNDAEMEVCWVRVDDLKKWPNDYICLPCRTRLFGKGVL